MGFLFFMGFYRVFLGFFGCLFNKGFLGFLLFLLGFFKYILMVCSVMCLLIFYCIGGAKPYLVVGTGYMQGEDAACKGRILVFEVMREHPPRIELITQEEQDQQVKRKRKKKRNGKGKRIRRVGKKGPGGGGGAK